MQNVSLKIKNYKSFGEPEQGFGVVCPVNLIIGKNNSGKSALLDLVEQAGLFNLAALQAHGHLNRRPEIFISAILTEDNLKRVFKQGRSGGHIPGDHWGFGQTFVGMGITCKTGQDKKLDFVSSDKAIKVQPQYLSQVQDMFVSAIENPFSRLIVKRLAAERDIVREQKNDKQTIDNNGRGTTDVIRAYLNQVELPSALIEQTLLAELNKIFEPDSRFTRILVQEQNSYWEVYLEQANLGRLALSQQGSGLKTVILALIFIHVLPQKESKQANEYIFCLEELENNMHPALLRRLLLYLRDFAMANSCTFFLTTHSSTAIDVFADDSEAQILHVSHDGTAAKVNPVKTYGEHCGILNDLGVRASDLLQANGVVWVEGPSDRIYFNRWIKVWSEGRLKEGVHYQCAFYGGKLLAHLSVGAPEEEAEAVKILGINRNAIIIPNFALGIDEKRRNSVERQGRRRFFIDGVLMVHRDKKMLADAAFRQNNQLIAISNAKSGIIMDRDTKTINKTKKRIVEEVEKIDGLA